MDKKLDSKVSSPSNPFVNLATLGSTTCAAGCQQCGVANAASYSSGCQVATCTAGFQPSEDQQSCEACNVANAASYSSGCQVATCIAAFQPSMDQQSCEACNVANAASFSSGCQVATCTAAFRPSLDQQSCEACNVANAASYSSGCQVATCAAGFQPSMDQQSCGACNVENAASYSSGCQVATCDAGFKPSADQQLCEVPWELVWFTGQRTNQNDCFDYDNLKENFQDSLARCQELGDSCKYIYDWGCHVLETAGVAGQPLSVLQSMTVDNDFYRVCGTEADSDISYEKVETNTPGTWHCALRKPAGQ